MKLAPPLTVLALAAALLAGCGSSSKGTTQSQAPAPQGARSPNAGAGSPSAPIGASTQRCSTNTAASRNLLVAGVACGTGRRVLAQWRSKAGCSSPPGASRYSCVLHGYHCLGAATMRGILVSCARRGRSIAFVAKPG